MRRESMPTLAELEAHKRIVPEIDPAAVVAMLEIRQAGEQVAEQILDVLQRLEKSGDVVIEEDAEDRRGKRVRLTAKGRAFMAEVLPPHYLRVTKLMEKLTQAEQEELIRLLRKLAGE